MRITGIIFLVLGGLAFIGFIIGLILERERGGDILWVGNNWSFVIASFLLGGGAALLVASMKRKRPR